MRTMLFSGIVLLMAIAFLSSAQEGGPGKMITTPMHNDIVGSSVVVKGQLPSEPGDDQFFWIAVKPLNAVTNWFPQNNAEKQLLIKKDWSFEGNAYLCCDNGQKFEIALLKLDRDLNQKFRNYVNNSMVNGNWSSITVGHPRTNDSVSLEEIEDSKLDWIEVELNKSI